MVALPDSVNSMTRSAPGAGTQNSHWEKIKIMLAFQWRNTVITDNQGESFLWQEFCQTFALG